MRELCWVLSISCLVPAGILAQDPGIPEYVVGGVVESAAGIPLAKAHVVLTPVLNRSGARDWWTGENGRFEFKVPAGKYRLQAGLVSFEAQGFKQHGLRNGFQSAIITGPGLSTENLEFRMQAPAAISGRVVDESGEPVEDATVQLLRIYHEVTSATGFQTTNDLGEYRFANLPGGNYYLAVTGQPWYAKNAPPQHEKGTEVFQPLFYPHATNASEAEPLTLQPGQQATADFALNVVPAVNVTIQCDGEDDANVAAVVYRGRIGSEDIVAATLPYCGRMHSQVALSAGNYEVVAISTKGTAIRVGRKQLSIAGTPAEVELRLEQPPMVAGRVSLPDRNGAGGLVVTLLDTERGRGGSRVVAADGSFNFPGVTPGTYEIRVSGRPGIYVESFDEGETKLRDRVLKVTGDPLPALAIHASTDSGEVKGFLKNKGSAVIGSFVVLTPKEQNAPRSMYRADQTDSDGSFDISAVPPGEYYVFGLTAEDVDYTNRKAVKPYLTTAAQIVVKAGGAVDLDLEPVN